MDTLRIWAVAHNVFRETIRDRILYFILVFFLIMAGAVLLLPEISNAAHAKITLDLGLALINFIGLIVAIFIGTGLVNKEIEKRTVFVLVAKPLSRAEFIIGKHLGLVALLSVLVLGMTLIFFGLALTQQQDLPLISMSWAVIFVVLELSLVVAAALMFGVFTSTLLAILYTIGIYITGHFSRALLELGQSMEGGLLKPVLEFLYLILPDLERLNLKNDAVYGQLPSISELATHATYSVIYTVMLLLITILVFARRQF